MIQLLFSFIFITLALILLLIFNPSRFDALFSTHHPQVQDIERIIESRLSLDRRFSTERDFPWGVSFCVFEKGHNPILYFKEIDKNSDIYINIGPLTNWQDNNWHVTITDIDKKIYIASIKSYLFPLQGGGTCSGKIKIVFNETSKFFLVEKDIK